MSSMYCCTQTSVSTFPVHLQEKNTGPCKSQGGVRQGWPTNTQWLGADNSIIISPDAAFVPCFVGPPRPSLSFPHLCIINLQCRGCSWIQKMNRGHKRCVDQKVKKLFFLNTDILAQSTLPSLRCSATGHHFIAFFTREVLKVRAERQAEFSEESCTVPLPWWLSIRKARQKRIQWDFNGNIPLPAC